MLRHFGEKLRPKECGCIHGRRGYLLSTQTKLFVGIHELNLNDFSTIMTAMKFSTRQNVWLFKLDASVKRCIQKSALITMVVARESVDDRRFFMFLVTKISWKGDKNIYLLRNICDVRVAKMLLMNRRELSLGKKGCDFSTKYFINATKKSILRWNLCDVRMVKMLLMNRRGEKACDYSTKYIINATKISI